MHPMERVALVFVVAAMPGCVQWNPAPAERCHVHGSRLHATIARDPTVRREIALRGHDSAYDAAKRTLFPFGERELPGDCIVHGSWLMPTHQLLWYCGVCRRTRDAWLLERASALAPTAQ